VERVAPLNVRRVARGREDYHWDCHQVVVGLELSQYLQAVGSCEIEVKKDEPRPRGVSVLADAVDEVQCRSGPVGDVATAAAAGARLEKRFLDQDDVSGVVVDEQNVSDVGTRIVHRVSCCELVGHGAGWLAALRHAQDQAPGESLSIETCEINRVFSLARMLSRGYHRSMGDPERTDGAWTLLTGHGHVLVEIARSPDARIRDISEVVGLTERTVQAIVADLEATGYLTRSRAGRRNVYAVNPDMLFRHPAQEGHRVGPFLDLLASGGDDLAETAATSTSKPDSES
jgi:MarR family